MHRRRYKSAPTLANVAKPGSLILRRFLIFTRDQFQTYIWHVLNEKYVKTYAFPSWVWSICKRTWADHARILPYLLHNFQAKMSSTCIVWRGVWKFAPRVLALSHLRRQATLYRPFRRIRQNLSNLKKKCQTCGGVEILTPEKCKKGQHSRPHFWKSDRNA